MHRLPLEYVPAHRPWSVGDAIVWWATADNGVDFWQYAPGDAEPTLIWHSPRADASIGTIVGGPRGYGFAEMSELAYGFGGWRLWYLPTNAAEPVEVDRGTAGDVRPPTLAMDDRRLAWAAFTLDPNASPESEPIDAQLSVLRVVDLDVPTEVRELASFSMREGLLWYPALNGDELWYGIIHGDWENAVQDEYHIEYLDLGDPTIAPERFPGIGREFNPAVTGEYVVWKRPGPGFSPLNWGDLFVTQRASGERMYIAADANRPSIGDRFVTFDEITKTHVSVFDVTTMQLHTVLRVPPGGKLVGEASIQGSLLAFLDPPNIAWVLLPT